MGFLPAFRSRFHTPLGADAPRVGPVGERHTHPVQAFSPPKEKDRVSSATEAKGRDPKTKVKTWPGFEAKEVRWTVHSKRKKARGSFPNQP